MSMERERRERRSRLERFADAVSGLTGGVTFVVAHLLWFGGWIAINTIGGTHFDPYPFALLALIVSFEAIILTGLVLMAQGRMTRHADARAHLDLQINLLAEQELTTILKMQCLLAERAGIDLTGIDPRLDQLRSHTDVQQLAKTIATELESTEESKRTDERITPQTPQQDPHGG